MRLFTLSAAAATALLASPAAAVAAEPRQSAFLTVPPVSLIVALIGLGVASLLLVEALLIRRVATGGAIADKISLVILATVCLAAAAIAAWLLNFVEGVTFDQLRFVADVLVITAMGLLAAYFNSVRRAFQGYLKSAQDALASTQADASEAE